MTLPTLTAELEALADAAVGGDWDYVPSSEHHGPYITTQFGTTIADFYTMTKPDMPSTANGGPSKPVHFMGASADANAEFAAKCSPKTIKALLARLGELEAFRAEVMACRMLTSKGEQRGWNVSRLSKFYSDQPDAAPSPIAKPTDEQRAAFKKIMPPARSILSQCAVCRCQIGEGQYMCGSCDADEQVQSEMDRDRE